MGEKQLIKTVIKGKNCELFTDKRSFQRCLLQKACHPGSPDGKQSQEFGV
jgi:hypothetical protein